MSSENLIELYHLNRAGAKFNCACMAKQQALLGHVPLHFLHPETYLSNLFKPDID